MTRIFTFICAVFLVYGTVCAAPSITGVSDTTPMDGQSIILTGLGFTTNNDSPSSWNDMESDTIGQVPTDQTIVNTTYGATIQANRSHSGSQSMEWNYYVDSGEGQADWQRNVIDLGQGEDKIYLTVWVYLDYGDSTSPQWQWKSFTITSSPKGYYDLSPVYPSDNLPYSAEAYNTTTVFMNYWWRESDYDPPTEYYGWFNNHGQGYYYDNVTDFKNVASMSYTSAPEDALLWNEWQRLEFYAQRASAPDTADGVWREQRIGRSGYTFNYTNVKTHLSGNDDWRYVTLSSALESVYDGTANLTICMDDVYVNTTQARVEIGDNADFASCTHREIQPFTAWSATSATITINQGSFANTLAYLFVVDEDGTSTSGYQITFSAGSSTRYYLDADGDGYSPGDYQDAESDPGATWYTAGELTAISGDCNDSNAAINPGATEVCGNEVDEDCDGTAQACPVTSTAKGASMKGGFSG